MKILRHPAEWAKGLIEADPETVAGGVLFMMHSTAPWPVSMEGISIPLDVYWLSESMMVLEHAELFPGMSPYWPEVSGKYVLELPMTAEGPRYKVGDFVEVPDDARANP